ncbi:hypothetical protein [Amycolatopsis sp. NPDC004378]
MTATLPRTATATRLTHRFAQACAVAAAVLSAVATTVSLTWSPLESVLPAACVALTVHAGLNLTIVDSRDARLRGTAIVVGRALAALLVAGSLWAATRHFPGQPLAILSCVLTTTVGPLAVLAVHPPPGRTPS